MEDWKELNHAKEITSLRRKIIQWQDILEDWKARSFELLEWRDRIDEGRKTRERIRIHVKQLHMDEELKELSTLEENLEELKQFIIPGNISPRHNTKAIRIRIDELERAEQLDTSMWDYQIKQHENKASLIRTARVKVMFLEKRIHEAQRRMDRIEEEIGLFDTVRNGQVHLV